MIQMIEQQLLPLPLSHPHPQLVAVNSLMFFPPDIFFTLITYVFRAGWFRLNSKYKKIKLRETGPVI